MNNSSQSNVLYSNTIFKQYLMEISTGIVWKNTSRASENESTDLNDLYRSELFVAANRGLLSFDIVKSFPRSVLMNASVTGADIEIYAADKRKIPVYLRDAIVKEYSKALTSINPETGRPAYYNSISKQYEMIYNESNDYYRMLMGLPNKDDYDVIYNTDPRWSTTTPIHEMSKVDRIEMERSGVLDDLLKKNPSKEYIAYLGKKYIDPFIARIADRFEILYSTETVSGSLNKDFMSAYNSARQMVLSIYYNTAFKKSNTYYDNFLAMCILFIALQIMQHKYLQVDITRDFYDTESLKLVYDSYGVPFYTEIPLEYHQKIVKNINKLISYKGSSKVFFDLFDIFDARSMNIYSYFLSKTHIIGADGVPLFNIKRDGDGNELYDEDGNPILDESNYRIDFSRVQIYDDPALAIADDNNHVEYNALTSSDPYWIEDAELITKLSNENFNYLESKYIGIQTVYDLMKITYENAYIFRLIMDNRELTDTFNFRWSELGINVSIFDIFVYLSALYCRFYGYEGIISDKIPSIMDTLGYNFEKSSVILKNISTNPTLQGNSELINLLMKLNVDDLNSIDEVYTNIEKIREIIVDGYINAKTIEEYNAYRELYDSLMISKEITATYTNKQTGEVYATFTDMLADNSPSLMQRYLLLEDNEIENEIVVTTDKIEELIQSVRHLVLSSGMVNHNMMEPLFKILKFFKSAKAELVDYNIVYTINKRGVNYFKLIDLLRIIIDSEKIDEPAYFTEFIKIITDMVHHKYDMLSSIEKFNNPNTQIYISEYINKLTDQIQYFTNIIEYIYKDQVWYIDFLETAYSSTSIVSYLSMEDKTDLDLSMLDIIEAKYKGIIKDSIVKLSDKLLKTDNPPLYHVIDVMVLLDKLVESSTINTEYKTFALLISKIHVAINSKLNAMSLTQYNDEMIECHSQTKYHSNESVFKNERIRVMVNEKNNDNLMTIDIPNKVSLNYYEDESIGITDSLFEYDELGNMKPVS